VQGLFGAAGRLEAEATARSFAGDRALGGYNYSGWRCNIPGAMVTVTLV